MKSLTAGQRPIRSRFPLSPKTSARGDAAPRTSPRSATRFFFVRSHSFFASKRRDEISVTGRSLDTVLTVKHTGVLHGFTNFRRQEKVRVPGHDSRWRLERINEASPDPVRWTSSAERW
ncbi:Hypothetical protein CINCED_3A000973 [Cinara cedri]|uniref:Uncharacterized protein n=1 Tax=Cinara cedri TaxID=506608 RepID=A0A5E4NHS8_9HEMI|nr:Hypothetical protein CINCED_3A000973 [Cinara cedri]